MVLAGVEGEGDDLGGGEGGVGGGVDLAGVHGVGGEVGEVDAEAEAMAGGQLGAGGLEGDTDRGAGGVVEVDIALAEVVDGAVGLDFGEDGAEVVAGGAGGAVEFDDRFSGND